MEIGGERVTSPLLVVGCGGLDQIREQMAVQWATVNCSRLTSVVLKQFVPGIQNFYILC